MSYNRSVINCLSFLTLLYFFFGFFINENSAGAGGFDGDLSLIWKNLQLIKSGILQNLDSPLYNDSRPPLAYIIHAIFNPFTENLELFRFSVLAISLTVPALLYFSIKANYPNVEKNLILAFSLIITLSPYFRTTAYWGLNENYGLIFLILTHLSYLKFKKNFKSSSFVKNIIYIFNICFLSSISIYFDQKLIFVPFLIFINLLILNLDLRLKFLSCVYFVLFSFPYLYLIYLWGSPLPPDASKIREVGSTFHIFHLGYCLTIISFYFIPFLIYKKNKLQKIIDVLNTKQFIYLFVVLILYLFSIELFFNFESLTSEGKGIMHKSLSIIINDNLFRKIITYFSFAVSIAVILLYIEKKGDFLFVSYFLILSFFTFPFYQEYLDPLIYILIFTFFNTKISLTYRNFYLIFLYFFLFSLGTNYYYKIIL